MKSSCHSYVYFSVLKDKPTCYAINANLFHKWRTTNVCGQYKMKRKKIKEVLSIKMCLLLICILITNSMQ